MLLQAVGETWDKFPELKFLALKRMYKYMVRSRGPLVSPKANVPNSWLHLIRV